MRPKTLLLATTNPAKLEKLRWLLAGLEVQCVVPPKAVIVPEEGRTHTENAEAKALGWSRECGMPAIASDGGLVIPALGDRWDALLTARFAGPVATDRDRLDGLLELMKPYEGRQRSAYWRESVVIAVDGNIVGSWQAESQPGTLDASYDPRDLRPGFWAFTIWRIPGLGKTYKDLTPQEIEVLEDHWGLLRGQIRAWFGT